MMIYFFEDEYESIKIVIQRNLLRTSNPALGDADQLDVLCLGPFAILSLWISSYERLR